GQADHVPLLTETVSDPAALTRPVLRQDPASRVVLVPACVDEHDPAVLTQSGAHRSLVPVPGGVADHGAVCVLALLDEVIQQCTVRSATRDTTTDTHNGDSAMPYSRHYDVAIAQFHSLRIRAPTPHEFE